MVHWRYHSLFWFSVTCSSDYLDNKTMSFIQAGQKNNSAEGETWNMCNRSFIKEGWNPVKGKLYKN